MTNLKKMDVAYQGMPFVRVGPQGMGAMSVSYQGMPYTSPEPAGHRYWRLYIERNVGNASFLDIREVELREYIGGADVTGSGTASASHANASWPASGAFDDNSSTAWAVFSPGPVYPEWLKYDFGAGNLKDIVEVALTPYTIAEMAAVMSVQYSDDDSTWTTAFRIVNGEWSGVSQAFSAATDPYLIAGATTKRFWRIKTTAVDGSVVFGMAKLTMATSPGGADQCTGGTPVCTSREEGAMVNLFDSDANSYWTGGRTPNGDWLGYIFPAEVDIKEVKVTARITWQTQSPKDFTIDYWDVDHWETAYTATGIAGWTSGETKTFTFAASGGPRQLPHVWQAGQRRGNSYLKKKRG